MIALYTNPFSHHQKSSKLPRRHKVKGGSQLTPQFKKRPNRPHQPPQTHPPDPLTPPLSPKPIPTPYQNITQNARLIYPTTPPTSQKQASFYPTGIRTHNLQQTGLTPFPTHLTSDCHPTSPRDVRRLDCPIYQPFLSSPKIIKTTQETQG